MVFAYTAAAVVAGLLIGFVMLSVIWTVRRTSRSIREKSVSLLGTYDELIEEKSRALQGLQKELREVRQERDALLSEAKKAGSAPVPETDGRETAEASPSVFLRTAQRLGAASYRDAAAGETYHLIREGFSYFPAEKVDALLFQEKKAKGAAGKLLSELPYETAYRLATLPEGQQHELLSGTLSGTAKELLGKFDEAHPRFDTIRFYDWLKGEAASEPGPIVLYLPPGKGAEGMRSRIRRAESGGAGHGLRSLVVKEDDSICEGFQIEADNVLYDYCIKTEETG